MREFAARVYKAKLAAGLSWLVRAGLPEADATDVAQQAAMGFWEVLLHLPDHGAVRGDWTLVDATGLPLPALSIFWTILKRRHADWLRACVADRGGPTRLRHEKRGARS